MTYGAQVTVRGVCLDDCGGVLLCRNDRGEWELPGGRPRPDEGLRDCLVREVAEETGVPVAAGELIGADPLQVTPGRWVNVLTYGCDPVTPTAPVAGDERPGARFLEPAALSALALPAVYRMAIAQHRNRELATARLAMHAVRPADVARLAVLSSDSRVNSHSPFGAPSVPQAAATARAMIADWEREGIGYWAVEHAGLLVGVAGVKPTSLAHRPFFNLYYRFSPAVWGRGLAAEACRAAIAAASAHDPARPILARTRPTNAAAARLALALGLTRAPELDSAGFVTFVGSEHP